MAIAIPVALTMIRAVVRGSGDHGGHGEKANILGGVFVLLVACVMASFGLNMVCSFWCRGGQSRGQANRGLGTVVATLRGSADGGWPILSFLVAASWSSSN